jgi:iron(III) transport system ATP-binding protein
MVSAVICKAVTKSFGTAQVLGDLSLEVPDGAVVTVLGESGSGKTTLLRLIAGFERLDGGTIMIGGRIADGPGSFIPPEKRRTGYVAQEGNLFPHLTAAGNVVFGLPRRERRAGQAEELLDLVGLGGLGKRYPHQLSGGQQQRVALARALAPRPQVVLLDEPFSSLDAGLRASLRQDVLRILREQRATTVLVTHDQQEALSAADLAGIITGGQIRQLATPETLYTRPADQAVARFLGEANIITGTASSGAVSTALGQLSVAAGQALPDGPAAVLIRPEQITLHPLASGPPPPGATAGRVVHREYFGHDSLLVVSTGNGDQPLRARCPGRAPAEVGDSVTITAIGDVTAWPAGAAQ